MADMTRQRSAHRLGFMVPLVLFVLFFVACCGVLACVFLRAASVSAQAGQYNAGVQLCRNQAECYRALGASRQTLPFFSQPQRLYFDSGYHAAEPSDASYYVMVSEQLVEESAGIVRNGTITAYTVLDEQLYSLDVAVYLPDGR